MLAIIWEEYQKYGCPNCGCDSSKAGYFSVGGVSFGTCRYCKLHFELRYDRNTKPCVKSGVHPENPEDPNSKLVMESGILIPHPRVGIPKWKWSPKDERPDSEGEYWKSRGIGYDLSGFVKTKKAGLRIHEMVKRVLGVENPKSWLDYREHEPTWIQYKFQPSEFNLEMIDSLTEGTGVITEEILEKSKI